MGLLGILLGLALLVWLAFRGWSVLLLAPAAALLSAAFAGEPLLAHWTQTFMGSGARASSRSSSRPPAWGRVRKADGRQRLGDGDRRFYDKTAGTAADAMAEWMTKETRRGDRCRHRAGHRSRVARLTQR